MRTPGLPDSNRSDHPALGLDLTEPERLQQVESCTRTAGPEAEGGYGYGETSARLRAFLDHVAAARP